MPVSIEKSLTTISELAKPKRIKTILKGIRSFFASGSRITVANSSPIKNKTDVEVSMLNYPGKKPGPGLGNVWFGLMIYFDLNFFAIQ